MADEAAPRVPKSKIYTRTGDSGTTGLFNGDRCGKSEDYIHALGDVDELNAHMGLVLCHCAGAVMIDVEYRYQVISSALCTVQSDLMVIGSEIATPLTTSSVSRTEKIPHITAQDIAFLESHIDAVDSKLPPLKTFVLPGGGPLSCELHICRAVCRRAERSLVPLLNRGDIGPLVVSYINRLSDLLFVVARYANMVDRMKDTPWVARIPEKK